MATNFQQVAVLYEFRTSKKRIGVNVPYDFFYFISLFSFNVFVVVFRNSCLVCMWEQREYHIQYSSYSVIFPCVYIYKVLILRLFFACRFIYFASLPIFAGDQCYWKSSFSKVFHFPLSLSLSVSLYFSLISLQDGTKALRVRYAFSEWLQQSKISWPELFCFLCGAANVCFLWPQLYEESGREKERAARRKKMVCACKKMEVLLSTIYIAALHLIYFSGALCQFEFEFK